MDMLPAEVKLLWLTAFACTGVGIYALNPVLLVGGVASFAWIIYRWKTIKRVKRVPLRSRDD